MDVSNIILPYKFLGTISDGDIRRALLKGQKLSSKITKYFQNYPNGQYFN